jgi:hypothetical protein
MNSRVLKWATCALLLNAQTVPDNLTLRLEMTAEASRLNLGSLPLDLQETITSGQVELRQQVLYDAPAKQLSVRTFTVPAGSPVPTSLKTIGNNEIEGFRVDVSYVATDQFSISFQGTVASGWQSPVHGVAAGDPFRLTARMQQVRMETPAGSQMVSHDAAGTVALDATPNRAPVAEAGPESIQSVSTEIALDAWKSFDPDGEELDYKWHVMRGAAAERGCETPTPVLQLLQGRGSYDVRLTVTDLRGATSYDWIRIDYVGR